MPIVAGKEGYALLLQTGETADGVEHLIDRQHPHDLFMELAASYSVADATRSAFVYFGLPGEPALGPTTFMHRLSGVEIPESPIGHHWLDSTHITFGVATVGLTRGGLKLEASKFHGREPDQDRTDIEDPEFDSHAFRATLNPSPRWSLQASYGRLHSPEQLAPEVNVDRGTFSVAWDAGRAGRPWQTTLVWGQNNKHPGGVTNAWLLESTISFAGRHTLMGRVERVEKDELFPHDDPRTADVFVVGKAGVGYINDLLQREHWVLGAGAFGTVSFVPQRLEDEYGWNPGSVMVFARVRVR